MGVFPLQMRLFLPQTWVDERSRHRKARVPTTIRFREKWRIGLEMIERIRAHGLPHEATVTDAGYGDSAEFRATLRRMGERYVVGVNLAALNVVRAGLLLQEPRTAP